MHTHRAPSVLLIMFLGNAVHSHPGRIYLGAEPLENISLEIQTELRERERESLEGGEIADLKGTDD